MKSWRTILVLFSVVILLSVILGVKIKNNTPEKQMEKLKNSYNEITVDVDIGNIEDDVTEEELESTIKKKIGNTIMSYMAIILILGTIAIFYTIVYYRVYIKLGINESFLKLYLIVNIASIISICLLNSVLTAILGFATSIISVILIVMLFKAVDLNPWLLLLIFIPIVGAICVSVLSIISVWRLGGYFGKGTGFKLGLLFLPFIFYPILAFSSEA